MELKGYLVGCYVLFGALLVGQLVFGNLVTFLAGYVAVFLFALVRTWSMGARKRFKGGSRRPMPWPWGCRWCSASR